MPEDIEKRRARQRAYKKRMYHQPGGKLKRRNRYLEEREQISAKGKARTAERQAKRPPLRLSQILFREAWLCDKDERVGYEGRRDSIRREYSVKFISKLLAERRQLRERFKNSHSG